jgi:Basic region leucine zipper
MGSSSHVLHDDETMASLTGSPSTRTLESDSFDSFRGWNHSYGGGDMDSGSSRRELNGTLIERTSSRCRSSRPPLPTLHQQQALHTTSPHLHTPPESAISPSSSNNSYYKSQDGRNQALNPASFSAANNSTLVETTSPSFSDDSLNPHSNRPRTSTKLFPLLPDLAAHYGIPQMLPPAPRTTPRTLSESSNSDQSPNSFAEVCSNYLTMLSQKSDDPAMSAADKPSTDMDSVDLFDPAADYAAQSVFEMFSGKIYRVLNGERPTLTIDKASPMFSPEYPMSEYLTSPVDDSPLLTTPHLGSEMLTSPLLSDVGDDMELFGGMSFFDSYAEKESAPVRSTLAALDMDNLYAMPSPVSPCLDPSSVYTSPQVTMSPSFPLLSSSKPKSSATGTRKNLTPDSLVPLDAPTQARKYTTPSATSRKEIPAVFAKKRARSQAFGDDEEEACEEAPLPPNASEREQIEWKRRQNTLAARKSRKRKLQHQLELEAAVERLTSEKETWKVRALTYQGMLRQHGVEVPEFS